MRGRVARFVAGEDQEDETEHRPWNWMGVVAAAVYATGFLIAVSMQSTELLIVISAIAFLLALVGAKQCRDKGQRGEAFALITMGLSFATLMIAIIAFLGRFQ